MPLLLCDLDDTLVERPPLFRAWARGFLADHDTGQNPGHDLDHALERVVEMDGGGHRSRADFLRDLTALTGQTQDHESLLADLDEAMGSSYRLTEAVVSALDAAADAGWTLVVVTNGPTVGQTRKIEAAGLDARATAVCISEEVGARKPDPLIFHTAAERARTTLAGAWMIGDNLDADIAGGAGVGVRTAWVDRPGDPLTYTSGARPDLVMTDFPEAVARILAES